MQEILIAGAGPAGTAAAISGLLEGTAVQLIDRARTPRHKVCGEFLSPGARHILEGLQVWDEFAALRPCAIRRCALHLGNETKRWTLSEPGWGLSRLRLDRLLLEKAQALGAVVRRGDVFDSRREVHSPASLVLACGRKSSPEPSDRLFGFKAHFEGPGDDAVELFFDACGYVGVSGVEDGLTNVCGIAPESLLRRHGFQFDEVVRRSAPLAERLGPLRRRMPWIAAGPLSFSPPAPGRARHGVYEAGDALGFVDPFTGSGILNALLTGRLAGQAAAHGIPAEQYRRTCHARLAHPFLISSLLRRLASHAAFHGLARVVPGRLLFRWTRAGMAREMR
ncbi:MAG: hypothetical protein LAP40_14275 [Acidobacteriia bacterium]|nr:hypothetical protein [Terriglobia bacterium]